MRYSPEHRAATRRLLVEQAGALAKKQGFGASGVDALAAAAGLTAGAFYAHFDSKAELLKAVVENELARSLAMFGDGSHEAACRAVDLYVSLLHADHPEAGCPLPSLTVEVARADDETRATFERCLLPVLDRIAAHAPGGDEEALAILAQAVGAVMLARALPTPSRRAALLEGVNRRIKQRLAPPDGLTPAPEPL